MSTTTTTTSNTNNSVELIALNRLTLSKLNVRTSNTSASADAELTASIREQGLLQSLIVVPTSDDSFDVIGGGRRLRCLQQLASDGEIPVDREINCTIIDNTDRAVNASLAENIRRRNMHPADIYIAFNAMIEAGQTTEDIQREFHMKAKDVAKVLRLANVHPTLFNLFRKDKLTIDQIMAFAATEDKKIQIAAFKESGKNTNISPYRIREAIFQEQHQFDTGIARFVGRAAYTKAGGVISSDLFNDSEYYDDHPLMVSLADKKLEKAMNAIKGDWAWKECTMDASAIMFSCIQLSGTTNPPKQIADKLFAIRSSIDKLEAREDDLSDKEYDELDKLNDEEYHLKERVRRDYTEFTDKQMKSSGCLVSFDRNGKIEIYRGVQRHEDTKKLRQSKTGEQATDRDKPVATQPDISQALKSDLGIYRMQAIAATLATSPVIAADVLHYSFIVSVIAGHESYEYNKLDIRTQKVNRETSREDYNGSAAAQSMLETYKTLDTAWFAQKSDAKRFEQFCSLSAKKKEDLLAYCTALLIESGSQSEGKGSATTTIVNSLDIQFNEWWRPTRENYFKRVNKTKLLNIGKKAFGKSFFTKFEGAKTKDILDHFEWVMEKGKESDLTEKEKLFRNQWVPEEIANGV